MIRVMQPSLRYERERADFSIPTRTFVFDVPDLPHWLHWTGQQTWTPEALEPSMPTSPLLQVEPGHQNKRGWPGSSKFQVLVPRNKSLSRHEALDTEGIRRT